MRDPGWNPLEERPLGVGPPADLRTGLRPRDVAAIAAVPAVLVAAFVRFGPSPAGLVLSHADPAWWTLATAHFVHRSAGHLVANLAAYGFVVPTAYVLAVLAGRRRAFLAALVGFPLTLPPLLSGFSVLAFDRGVALGFSGVTLAYLGVLPVFVGAFVDRRLSPGRGRAVGRALFVLGLGAIVALSVQRTALRVGVAVLAVVVTVGALRAPVRGLLPDWRSLSTVASADGQVAAVGVGVFLLGLAVAVPRDPSGGPVVAHTYGHLLGYALGYLLPLSAGRVLGAGPLVEVDS